ncbi:hypothetical protein J3R30DRAFT_614890 [Lentinula aciculospora]|uniref:Fe2OG dioxygenase domain-containing protein n=1 Tax=Lentinula aciculospora TaxID=153920 RepID=A0A9W9DKK3_9AGAR|nr:hypothetical protein J3R30DRAFT_614890 [Lentinula aciculospora]
MFKRRRQGSCNPASLLTTMSNNPSTAIPFTSTKLGSFLLQHRIVINPPRQASIASVEEFYRACASEGGLVIVPFDADPLTRKKIVDIIHSANGVAFCSVDAPPGPASSFCERLQDCIADALSSGYDGIELDASQNSVLQGILLTSADAVDKVSDIVQAIASAVPENRLGVRFSPFSFNGNYTTKCLQLYTTIIERIKQKHPSLAFMHFLGSILFEDFEYFLNQSLDVFRAALAFPMSLDTADSSSIRTISSDNYTPAAALHASIRRGELVSFGPASLSNPDIISVFRQGLPLQVPPSVAKRLSDIRTTFQTGTEYVFEWDSNHRERILKAMECLGRYLGQFEPALSYEGTDKRVVWRKSCWFASKGIAHPLLYTEQEISKFDGDLKDGLSGLVALQSSEVRSSLEYLKHVLDSTLVSCCHAIGLDMNMIQRCSVRYRIIKYVAHAGSPGGIGLHPDGNLLSALITDGPGLGVYDFDGTYREPDVAGTILMGGSTLYRWSKGKYLPTFHDVSIGREQKKTSIVAFFNLPDMENIPQSIVLGTPESSFFHNIKYIKEDDKSPAGELASLWKTIVDKHSIILPS